MRYLALLVISLFLAGCGSFYRPARLLTNGDPRPKYYEQIREWQQRLKYDQKWTEDFIKEVIEISALYSLYKADPIDDDYWDTPREFWSRGFIGDCEDFAIWEWFILKTVLQCPYDIHLCAVHLMGDLDHLVLTVHMPDGWKMFQSLPGVADFDRPLYTPIVEWDDEDIYVFDPD